MIRDSKHSLREVCWRSIHLIENEIHFLNRIDCLLVHGNFCIVSIVCWFTALFELFQLFISSRRIDDGC